MRVTHLPGLHLIALIFIHRVKCGYGKMINNKLFLKKGMSVVEYSLLIAVVVAMLLAMQSYLHRAVSGRWREAGDVFGFGRQYQPGVTDIK